MTPPPTTPKRIETCLTCGSPIYQGADLHIHTVWQEGTKLGPARQDTINLARRQEDKKKLIDLIDYLL